MSETTSSDESDYDPKSAYQPYELVRTLFGKSYSISSTAGLNVMSTGPTTSPIPRLSQVLPPPGFYPNNPGDAIMTDREISHQILTNPILSERLKKYTANLKTSSTPKSASSSNSSSTMGRDKDKKNWTSQGVCSKGVQSQATMNGPPKVTPEIIQHRTEFEAARSFDIEDDLDFMPRYLFDDNDWKALAARDRKRAFENVKNVILAPPGYPESTHLRHRSRNEPQVGEGSGNPAFGNPASGNPTIQIHQPQPMRPETSPFLHQGPNGSNDSGRAKKKLSKPKSKQYLVPSSRLSKRASWYDNKHAGGNKHSRGTPVLHPYYISGSPDMMRPMNEGPFPYGSSEFVPRSAVEALTASSASPFKQRSKLGSPEVPAFIPGLNSGPAEEFRSSVPSNVNTTPARDPGISRFFPQGPGFISQDARVNTTTARDPGISRFFPQVQEFVPQPSRINETSVDDTGTSRFYPHFAEYVPQGSRARQQTSAANVDMSQMQMQMGQMSFQNEQQHQGPFQATVRSTNYRQGQTVQMPPVPPGARLRCLSDKCLQADIPKYVPVGLFCEMCGTFAGSPAYDAKGNAYTPSYI